MSNKILIVEDDPNILAALKYNLGKEGYNTLTAVDGVQALALARESKPALIVLDIMLPELSGFEVCRILRKEMAVPIIMLTARGDEIDKVTGLDLGADDYMTKTLQYERIDGPDPRHAEAVGDQKRLFRRRRSSSETSK